MQIPTEIVKNASTIIFDSDGVLVEEGNPLPGSQELTKLLSSLNKQILVFSNNSTNHPKQMKQTYSNHGIIIDDIINSGLLAVNYCKHQNIQKVYVVGETGFCKLLIESGLQVFNKFDPSIDAVLVGMDRTLTYEKLAIATRLIRNGARFICTNSDASFPTPRGLEPGAGSMIAALITSSDQKPEIILGKPSTYGFKYMFDTFGLTNTEVCMVGDRFETDIIGALELNIPSFVVNTGIAKTREFPGKYQSYDEVPVIQSLSELVSSIKKHHV